MQLLNPFLKSLKCHGLTLSLHAYDNTYITIDILHITTIVVLQDVSCNKCQCPKYQTKLVEPVNIANDELLGPATMHFLALLNYTTLSAKW